MLRTIGTTVLLALLVRPALGAPTPAPSAPPAKDDPLLAPLLAIQMQLFDGWKAKSLEPFEKNLAEDALVFSASGVFDRATQLEQQKGANARCTVSKVTMLDPEVRRLAPDTALLLYVLEQQATCGGGPIPSPLRIATLYVRRAGRWVIVLRTSAPLKS